MLATVTTKTIADRWKAWVIAGVSMGLLVWMAMGVYKDIDLSFYNDMPEVFLSMMGIPPGADVASLALGAIYSSYGALTLAALALAMGAAAVAGEERDGTMGILIANPVSRTSIVVSKSVAMVTLTTACTALLWLAAVIVPAAVDVSTTGLHSGAMAIHLLANALFYGFLALAIGSWTGKSSLAVGVAVGVMLVSFIASAVFPLVEALGGLVAIMPWHYYNGGDPLLNGVVWGDVAVLVGAAVVLAAISVIGVNRRDLRSQSVGNTLLDVLRSHPYTKRVADRLIGSARVSRISIKTASEHQGVVIVAGYSMILLGLMMGPLYGILDEGVKSFADQLPEAMLALLGGADMSTAEGFYQGEIFSLMAPIAVMAVTVAIGARSLAGEEQRRTMGVLLANPISRTHVLLEKAVAMTVGAILVGLSIFVGVVAGSLVGGLGLSIANVAATTALATLVGLVFGAVALALSAGIGRAKAAAYGASGVALVLFILNAFLPLSESLAPLAKWSPFYYYLTNDPLGRGMDWGHAAVLAVLCVGLVAASIPLFQRRDLRIAG